MATSSKRRRNDYMECEEYFMATALLAAQRSKDPNCQVGACVVNMNKRIVGIGYNGMPFGCHDDKFSWDDKTNSDNKQLYVCHAEMNAIIIRNAVDVQNCTIYVTLFPCNECAKIIIQAGIKEVVYLSDQKVGKKRNVASKSMLDHAEVKYRKFERKNEGIVLSFAIND